MARFALNSAPIALFFAHGGKFVSSGTCTSVSLCAAFASHITIGTPSSSKLGAKETSLSPAHRDKKKEVRQYYRALYRAWGAQHWWPAETRFEVIVGAYLTQNTAWTNVELALANLRAANVLSVEGIRGTSLAELERLIRPSGYFRQKATRLKTFVAFLDKTYQWLAGSIILTTHRPASRRTAEPERSGARDRGLDSSLCGESSSLRRGRLHSPHPGSARDSAGEHRLRGHRAIIRAVTDANGSRASRKTAAQLESGHSRSCTPTLGHEHRRAHGVGSGLQRDARSHRGSRKELLQKNQGCVRRMSASAIPPGSVKSNGGGQLPGQEDVHFRLLSRASLEAYNCASPKERNHEDSRHRGNVARSGAV